MTINRLASFNFRDREIAVFDRSLHLPDIYKLAGEISSSSGRKCGPLGPLLADRLLTSGINMDIVRSSPFVTSALIGYEKEGCRLSSEIVYNGFNGERLILPTKDFQGERGIALFIETISLSDFSYTAKGEIILGISSERMLPIPAFPDTSGAYDTYQKTTIPHGLLLEEGGGRFLSRTKQQYIGPVARGYSFDGHAKEYVLVDFNLSYKFGCVFEFEPLNPGQ